MPIYEYRCDDCGKEFEKLQKISDDPLSECVFCSGKVKKLVSHSSFHLKGTGWYVTDYAKKSGSKNATEPSPSTTEKAETVSDSPKKESSDSSSTPKADDSSTT